MSTKHKGILLRGYIEQVGKNDFFAICITLNVCTRGRSMAEAEMKLNEAVQFYLKDAMDDNEFDQWVPRRAPLSYYFRYFTIFLRTHSFFLPSHKVMLIQAVHA